LTTFTVKAAKELRSRLIEWGLLLRDHLRANPIGDPMPFRAWLDSIDINRFVTGTLDSICEEILSTHRDPADASPVLVEGFVGNALLARQGLFPGNAHRDPSLSPYISDFTFDGSPPRNFYETLRVCRTVI